MAENTNNTTNNQIPNKRSISKQGELNPMYGRHHTEQTKQQQSQSMKNVWYNLKQHQPNNPN